MSPDCELYAHPNVTGEGCPCGAVVATPPPPLLPLAVMFHLERSVHAFAVRKRSAARFRPRLEAKGKPYVLPPRPLRAVYP